MMRIEFDVRVKGRSDSRKTGSSLRFWLTISLAVVGILATVYFGLQVV